MSAVGFAKCARFVEATQLEKWSKKLRKRNKEYVPLVREDFKAKNSEFELRKMKPNVMRNRGREGLERWTEGSYYKKRRASGNDEEKASSNRPKRRDYGMA